MALTAGLLTFLGVEALFEALELQAGLPAAFGGPGLVLLGLAASALGMTFLATRLSRGRVGASGLALAALVAVGIGVHNLGEGLAIGTSFARARTSTSSCGSSRGSTTATRSSATGTPTSWSTS